MTKNDNDQCIKKIYEWRTTEKLHKVFSKIEEQNSEW